MAKVYKDLQSLSKALEPEIQSHNQKAVQEAVRDLEAQARSLLRDAQYMWVSYEQSYMPKIYEPTGATRSGIKLSEPRVEKLPTGEIQIEIDLVLEDSYMWHDSVMGGKQGHSFMLISEGWKWSNSYHDVHRFTHFEGVGIIGKLVSKYNRGDYEFKFYFEGEEYTGDRENFSFTR